MPSPSTVSAEAQVTATNVNTACNGEKRQVLSLLECIQHIPHDGACG